MQATTRAKISRNELMDYLHEDRDLLMGLQDDLSDMLSATGQFSITLDEILQNFMPYIPLYLIENEDEIKEIYSDRIDDDDNFFILYLVMYVINHNISDFINVHCFNCLFNKPSCKGNILFTIKFSFHLKVLLKLNVVVNRFNAPT